MDGYGAPLTRPSSPLTMIGGRNSSFISSSWFFFIAFTAFAPSSPTPHTSPSTAIFTHSKRLSRSTPRPSRPCLLLIRDEVKEVLAVAHGGARRGVAPVADEVDGRVGKPYSFMAPRSA